MFRLSIRVALIGCFLHYSNVMAFGVESALPNLQDLPTHLPHVAQAATSAFATHASPHESIIGLSNSVPTIHSTNNLLAANTGDNSLVELASSLFQDYRKALDANPLRVKIITGCMLAIVGDAIAQSVTPDPYNKKRASAFVVFDGVWRTCQQVTYGPIIMNCNGKFSTSLLGNLPIDTIQDLISKQENTAVLGAIEQTLVSQLLLIPLLYYPIFYSVTGWVQDLTIPETIQRAKDTFIPLMKRNLLFWIPVQFGAFYFVEENLQIPVLTAAGLIWTVILSLSAGNVNQSTEEEIPEAKVIEEKMVADAGSGTAVLQAPSFFFRFNGESSEDNAAGSLTTPAGAPEQVGKGRK